MTEQPTTQKEQGMSTAFVAWRITGRYVDAFDDEISARRYLDRFTDDAGTHRRLEVFTSGTHKVMFTRGYGYVVPLSWDLQAVEKWHHEVVETRLMESEAVAPAKPSAEQAFKANLLQWLSEEVDAYCHAWPQLAEIPADEESRPGRLEDFAQFLAQVRLPQLYEKELGARVEFELTQRRIWGPWDEKS